MRFLISALGSYGDVHPMVGLGAALRGQGHCVAIVTNPYFESVVVGAGLELLPIGTAEEYVELTRHPDLWHPFRGQRMVMQKMSTEVLRPLYELLATESRSGETVLGAHALDLASRLAGEKLNLPVASIDFAPSMYLSVYQSPRLPPALLGDRVPRWLKRSQFWLGERLLLDRWLAGPVNELRQELGLAPLRRLFSQWWHSTDEVLGLFPEWFAPRQPDWPANLTLTGFPLWDVADENPLPDALQTFLDEDDAPIVFTPGSANTVAERFFEAAVDACRRLGRRGILLTKYERQLPHPLPASVRHFGFVPLSRVLPQAAAFVHHGGIGSCAQGLAAGVPQLVRPMAYDQFDNSARLMRLGTAAELSVRRFRGPRVAATLKALLNSSTVRERCRTYASCCDGQAALAQACDVLQRLGKACRTAAT